MSHGVGHRRSLDLVWLWLWCRPVATAQIRPLAWEPPYVTSAALKKKKKKIIYADPQGVYKKQLKCIFWPPIKYHWMPHHVSSSSTSWRLLDSAATISDTLDLKERKNFLFEFGSGAQSYIFERGV